MHAGEAEEVLALARHKQTRQLLAQLPYSCAAPFSFVKLQGTSACHCSLVIDILIGS
jgi:hypothetical protein